MTNEERLEQVELLRLRLEGLLVDMHIDAFPGEFKPSLEECYAPVCERGCEALVKLDETIAAWKFEFEHDRKMQERRREARREARW